MLLVRRRFLHLAGAALALPAATRTALAQAAPGMPKLTLLLKTDLQGQDQKVQETVVNILEMAPGVGAPWHMSASDVPGGKIRRAGLSEHGDAIIGCTTYGSTRVFFLSK